MNALALSEPSITGIPATSNITLSAKARAAVDAVSSGHGMHQYQPEKPSAHVNIYTLPAGLGGE